MSTILRHGLVANFFWEGFPRTVSNPNLTTYLPKSQPLTITQNLENGPRELFAKKSRAGAGALWGTPGWSNRSVLKQMQAGING